MVIDAFKKAFRRTGAPPREMRFTVNMEFDDVDGYWVVECLELPGAMSQGKTPEEAFNNITDAIAAVLQVRLQAQLTARLADHHELVDPTRGVERKIAICV
jgi:predicted RNase H-like HicB family nuclease